MIQAPWAGMGKHTHTRAPSEIALQSVHSTRISQPMEPWSIGNTYWNVALQMDSIENMLQAYTDLQCVELLGMEPPPTTMAVSVLAKE